MNLKQKALATAIALGLIMTSEGLLLHAKPDIATGRPNICYGETHDVKFGDTKTRDQCVAILMQRGEPRAEAQVDSCIPEQPTAHVRGALIDFAYNEGGGKKGVKDGLCVLKNGRKPTIRRRAEAGDWKGVCGALRAWDKAGGKKLGGLATRRAKEIKTCEVGL